jgi:hypothetical protein
MRMLGMGFGLIGLLITVAIMLKMEADSAPATIQASNQAKQQIEQIGGLTQDGTRVEDTYQLTAQRRADGKIQYLEVTSLNSDSPLASYFGLKLHDQIVMAEYQSVEWAMPDAQDEESAGLSVREAYTHSGHLTVMRNGQQLVLPSHGQPMAAAPGQTSPQQQQSDQNDPLKAVNDRLQGLPSGN